MPTIPLPPIEQNTPEQKAYFDALMKRMGFDHVPLISRAMVIKLDIATKHSQGMGVLMGDNGVLAGWFKEMVAVSASAVFACDY